MKAPIHFWRFVRTGSAALVIVALAAATALAQVDTYTFTALTGTLTPLPATATNAPAVLGDDVVSGTIPLNFSFFFDGVPYTSVRVSSNGFVSFNSNATSYLSNSLSGTVADTEKPLVALFWDDLDGRDPSARASYQTIGAAPNRVFTFEWLNWFRYGNTGGPSFSMQAKLYEGSNRVEFIYRREANTVSGASASIGLAGDVVGTTPSDFLSLSDATATATASSTSENSSIANVPVTGQVYQFNPPVPSACPTPRGLRGVAASATSATLTWAVVGGTGPFTVQYGPAGFNPAQPSSATNTYTTLTGVTGTSTTVTGLAPVGSYQFYVTQTCGGAAGSSGRSNAGTFILNDDPCGATALPVNNVCTPVNGSTVGATTTTPIGYSNPGSCGFNNTPLDVWFSFTTAASGPTSTSVRITVTGSAAELVRGFSGSCTGALNELSCQDNNGSGPTPNLDLTGLTPNTTYYISVSNYSSFQPQLGSFTICASPVPNCQSPLGLGTGTLTNTTAQLTWAGTTSPGSTFTVIYGTPGFDPATSGTTISGITTISTTLTGLSANTAYEFYVLQVCGGFNGSSILVGPYSFSTPLTIPNNDEPCGALPLGNTNSGSNLGATASGQSGIVVPACSPSQAPKDVWFSFTPLTSSIQMTFTGNPAGMMRVFTSPDCANGPFNQVACQAGAGNNRSVGTVNINGLTPGQRYYLAVSGFGSSDAPGAFTITATGLALSGRAQVSTDALLAYPNPSNTGQLTVRRAAGQPAGALTLLNALGQAVRSLPLNGGTTEATVKTNGLAAGVYTLRLTQGSEVLTRKVVLE